MLSTDYRGCQRLFLLASLGVAYLAFVAWASALVARDPDTDRKQRLGQLLLVFFLPFVGLVLVLTFHLSRRSSIPQPENTEPLPIDLDGDLESGDGD